MYEVRIIVEGNPGIGDRRRSFSSYPKAVEYAQAHAWDHDCGVCIVDTKRGIVNWGDDTWTSSRDCTKLVSEPFYARRLRESKPSLRGF